MYFEDKNKENLKFIYKKIKAITLFFPIRGLCF